MHLTPAVVPILQELYVSAKELDDLYIEVYTIPECRFIDSTPFQQNYTAICTKYDVVNFKECCGKLIPCFMQEGEWYPKHKQCMASSADEGKCYLLRPVEKVKFKDQYIFSPRGDERGMGFERMHDKIDGTYSFSFEKSKDRKGYTNIKSNYHLNQKTKGPLKNVPLDSTNIVKATHSVKDHYPMNIMKGKGFY